MKRCLPTLIAFLYFNLVFSENVLKFQDAIERVLSCSLRLKAEAFEVRGRAGEKTQALMYPNPEISYEVENVFGNKNWKGWDGAESRYEVEQLIELGGKRNLRAAVASYQLCAAQAAFQAVKVEVLNQLMKRLALAASRQEEMHIAEEQKKIARETLHSAIEKVEAGKASLVQQNKAEIALACAEIKCEKAVVNLRSTFESLALLWGCPFPDFDWIEFPFFEIEEPKPLSFYEARLCHHPELLHFQFDHRAACLALSLEKSAAIPDIILTAGYKTEEEENKRGMIFGASLPIPIFDRNQGNICKARAEVGRTAYLQKELEVELKQKLSQSHKELVCAYQEAERLQTTVLRSADHAFTSAHEGYREGKFEYLDMLDSQRMLFDIKENVIQALLNYHQRRADLEFLNSRLTAHE